MPNATIQYHSQPATAQDKWVLEKLANKRGGYFVEVGAHNGIRHSNTLTLEESFDWTGVLIEANPKRYEELCANRPECECVQAVVGPYHSQQEPFATAQREYGGNDAFNGLTRHMSKQWVEAHEFHKSEINYVATETLYSVLVRKMPWTQTIDYMSIDVEGAEFDILESFFWAERTHMDKRTFTPTLLTVEFLYDRELLDRLERMLESKYILDEVRAFDACFVRRNA